MKKQLTLKQLIKNMQVKSEHYQLSYEEAVRILNSKTAPAWAQDRADIALKELDEDARRADEASLPN